MFHAQHFPKKLLVNEFFFDMLQKRLDGEDGDDISSYRPGAITAAGQRIRTRDCRINKTKQPKDRENSRKIKVLPAKTTDSSTVNLLSLKRGKKKRDFDDLEKYEKYLLKIEKEDQKKERKKKKEEKNKVKANEIYLDEDFADESSFKVSEQPSKKKKPKK